MLAGGLGTRVASLTEGHVPKALLDVAGRPFLDRRIDDLRLQGVQQVVVMVGHHADQVQRHLATTDLGLEVVTISEGPTLLGTGGAIAAALGRLPASFWVTYADTFLDAPMAEIEQHFDASGATGLMTVLRNEDRWQPSNVDVVDGLVTAYAKGRPPGTFRFIDYGLLLFRREAFAGIGAGATADLSEVVGPLIHSRSLVAFEVTEPFHDIGTPAALEATVRWIQAREGRGEAG
jgi:NDP-sugar pyrophosphorylase family protein